MILKLTNLKSRISIEVNPIEEKEKILKLYDEYSMLVLFIDNRGYTIPKKININLFFRLMFELEEQLGENKDTVFKFLNEYFYMEDIVNFDIQDIHFHPNQTKEETYNILLDCGCLDDYEMDFGEEIDKNTITKKLFTTGLYDCKYFEWEDGIVEWHHYKGAA